ncbi:MAG: hypothetical protein K0S08_542 [Gammaproteobacteria bacterium]|jgi:hypothetical protein|nr:hypothetical protein [Gammaproteobacteria bacterium]
MAANSDKITYHEKFFSVGSNTDILELTGVEDELDAFVKQKRVGVVHWGQGQRDLIKKFREISPGVLLQERMSSLIPERSCFEAMPIQSEMHHKLQILLLCIATVIEQGSSVDSTCFNREEINSADRLNPILQHMIRERYCVEGRQPSVRRSSLSALIDDVKGLFASLKVGGDSQRPPAAAAKRCEDSLKIRSP